jgi:quinol monooxygenase YgiN
MAKVRVIARFVAREAKAAEVRSVLQKMLKPTRAEQGCEYYELFESSLDGHFYFNELWNSQEDLDVHAASGHFREHILGPGLQDLLREPFEVSLLTEIPAAG